MKIICTILFLLLAMEILFRIWDARSKTVHKKQKAGARLVFALLLILGLLIGVLKGSFRYMPLILILGIQAGLAFLTTFLHNRKKAEGNVQEEIPYKGVKQTLRTIGSAFLYLMLSFPAILFPQYKLPENTGTQEVLSKTYTWEDHDRLETYRQDGSYRSVTIEVFYPAQEGTYPLVVFSHGATGMIQSNISTCENLASNGYIVVSIGHPYQAIMVQDISGNVTLIDPEFMNNVIQDNGSDSTEYDKKVFEMSREWLAVRTGDMNFVLDTILQKQADGEDIFAMADPSRIGVFGHSLGGATAVAVGRERTDIDAVIDLEGTMFSEYEGYDVDHYLYNNTPYTTPLLDVNSAQIYESAKAYTKQEYVNFYVLGNASDAHEAIFRDAGHLNFTDLPLVSPILAHMLGCGSVNAKKCLTNVNEMVLQYFNYYLKDAASLAIQETY